MSLKDRERDATVTASVNYSQMKANILASSLAKQPGMPNFSASVGATAHIPKQYSPLRSKTPPNEKRMANDQEAV